VHVAREGLPVLNCSKQFYMPAGLDSYATLWATPFKLNFQRLRSHCMMLSMLSLMGAWQQHRLGPFLLHRAGCQQVGTASCCRA